MLRTARRFGAPPGLQHPKEARAADQGDHHGPEQQDSSPPTIRHLPHRARVLVERADPAAAAWAAEGWAERDTGQS